MGNRLYHGNREAMLTVSGSSKRLITGSSLSDDISPGLRRFHYHLSHELDASSKNYMGVPPAGPRQEKATEGGVPSAW